MNEEELLAFVRLYIRSVYTLELLLLVSRRRDKMWQSDELVRELRSSWTAVDDALNRMVHAGFIERTPAGDYHYAPTSSEREQIVAELDGLYASRPLTVVQAIIATPDEKLRAFSDAFKLKE